MMWHWIGLTVFSLTLLPTGLVMATDRVPKRFRGRLTPVRPRGWALLLIYATGPVNALPRLADAAPDVTLVCTAVGGMVAVMRLPGIGRRHSCASAPSGRGPSRRGLTPCPPHVARTAGDVKSYRSSPGGLCSPWPSGCWGG